MPPGFPDRGWPFVALRELGGVVDSGYCSIIGFRAREAAVVFLVLGEGGLPGRVEHLCGRAGVGRT
jgi:hypothetical protein